VCILTIPAVGVNISATCSKQPELSDPRFTDRVKVDCVGETMLPVDASLHRGGLLFPELPYRELVETEGFGILARDLGVQAVGLSNVEIVHVPW
jgi:hypothetical protein